MFPYVLLVFVSFCYFSLFFYLNLFKFIEILFKIIEDYLVMVWFSI